MNLLYLGDALDHWKGSLLERLQQARLLTNLAADAMASDALDWTPFDWHLFATLLRIADAQIVGHPTHLANDRAAYFREIAHSTDIFLDPDTGIATSRVPNRSQYLMPFELHGLLAAHPSRVVATYQHIRAVTTRHRLTQIVSVLAEGGHRFSCCSYESSTVAMLFFSSDRDRIEAIHQHHVVLLGRHAIPRTQFWHYDQAA
jgi:hypothetical protein